MSIHTTTTVEDVINAAASVATDVAEGKLDPAALEQQAVAELTELVGTVVGPDDPIWDLQCRIARGVLAAGGIGTDEQAEWLAVSRRRDGVTEVPVQPIPIVLEAPGPVLDPPDEVDDEVEDDVVPDQDQILPATSDATVDGCVPCQSTPAMVTTADGREIPSRLIAARGRGVPDAGFLG